MTFNFIWPSGHIRRHFSGGRAEGGGGGEKKLHINLIFLSPSRKPNHMILKKPTQRRNMHRLSFGATANEKLVKHPEFAALWLSFGKIPISVVFPATDMWWRHTGPHKDDKQHNKSQSNDGCIRWAGKMGNKPSRRLVPMRCVCVCARTRVCMCVHLCSCVSAEMFLTGFTNCACWVLTAWPLNVKPRLGLKHKHWSKELFVWVWMCVQEQQHTVQALTRHTCNNINGREK